MANMVRETADWRAKREATVLALRGDALNSSVGGFDAVRIFGVRFGSRLVDGQDLEPGFFDEGEPWRLQILVQQSAKTGASDLRRR